MGVTIADSLFLQYSKSASLREEQTDVCPTYFEWERADAQTARFVTDSDLRDAKGEGQVAWLLEPEGLHPENYQYLRDNPEKFDHVLVPSMESRIPGAKWYPYGGSSIAFDKWGLRKKSKFISILLSDKDSMEGHHLRHNIVRRYGKYIDIYTDIPDKIRALEGYEYSIIVESEGKRGYFTEKLIDCLSVGTIPIYWGSLLAGFTAVPFKDIDSLYEVIFSLKAENIFERSELQLRMSMAYCKMFAICEDTIFLMYPELFE